MPVVRANGSLSRLVGAVMVAGCLAFAVAAVLMWREAFGWSRFGIVVALVVGADVARVRLRRGGSEPQHDWHETAFILAIGLLPAGALVFAMAATKALTLLVRRRPLHRVAFNASALAIGTLLGATIVGPARLYASPRWEKYLEPRVVCLVVVASIVPTAVSALLTMSAVAVERHRRLRDASAGIVRVTAMLWARNVAAALGLLAALHWSMPITLVVLASLFGLHFLSVDRTAIRQERYAWHRLQTAIDELRDVELSQLLDIAVIAAATMMRADAAEIELDPSTGHFGVVRASDIERPHTPTSDDRDHRGVSQIALSTREGPIGVLRILFTQQITLTLTERECLNAFANALAVALANAMKFDAIRREAEERVRAAHTDPVTGVGNLLLLEQEAGTTLAASRAGNLAAVAVIGLNRFAEVNDLLGAHAADQMLRAVARRLSDVVRSCDVVARLHGAEYVLLLRELASEAAAEGQAEQIVRALGTAITADGLDLTVDAHTGVACAPVDGERLDDLVRRARLAMYKARTNDVPVFRYQAELEPPAIAQVELVRDLREALAGNQLILHFQPKFGLRGGLPIAAEALVRWEHPERGMIPPAEFIPLLERCGLVGDLTRYVLDAALAECAEWHKLGLPFAVAVNLSARNLIDEDLPRYVLECLSRYDIPADRLICEITETAVFSRSPIAAAVLDQLRVAGVSLSLDDFCTGYSSLSLLRERTIDEIKIDRSFVAGLGVDGRTTQIVTALIELAHRCDISVTAEGIETAEQQQLLTTLGCDHAQGFLLARPMPAGAVRTFFLEAMKAMPLPRTPERPRRKSLRSASGHSRWEDVTELAAE